MSSKPASTTNGSTHPEYIRPHQLAARLGVCRASIIRLLYKKKIPGFKLGGCWLINERQFNNYVNALIARTSAECQQDLIDHIKRENENHERRSSSLQH